MNNEKSFGFLWGRRFWWFLMFTVLDYMVQLLVNTTEKSHSFSFVSEHCWAPLIFLAGAYSCCFPHLSPLSSPLFSSCLFPIIIPSCIGRTLFCCITGVVQYLTTLFCLLTVINCVCHSRNNENPFFFCAAPIEFVYRNIQILRESVLSRLYLFNFWCRDISKLCLVINMMGTMENRSKRQFCSSKRGKDFQNFNLYFLPGFVLFLCYLTVSKRVGKPSFHRIIFRFIFHINSQQTTECQTLDSYSWNDCRQRYANELFHRTARHWRRKA